MDREPKDRYMVIDREHEVKGVCDNIVCELLIRDKELHTSDIMKMMCGVRFSDAYIKAVHAMVSRELIQRGYMLVCYPNVVSPLDSCRITVDGYFYRAVPIPTFDYTY